MAKKKKKKVSLLHIADWRERAIKLGWGALDVRGIQETYDADPESTFITDVQMLFATIRSFRVLLFDGIAANGSVVTHAVTNWRTVRIPRSLDVATVKNDPSAVVDERPWCPCHGFEKKQGCSTCGVDPVVSFDLCSCVTSVMWGENKGRLIHVKDCPVLALELGPIGPSVAAPAAVDAVVKKAKKKPKQKIESLALFGR